MAAASGPADDKDEDAKSFHGHGVSSLPAVVNNDDGEEKSSNSDWMLDTAAAAGSTDNDDDDKSDGGKCAKLCSSTSLTTSAPADKYSHKATVQ